MGLRVLLTGDWPVGDLLRNDVSFRMPLCAGTGERLLPAVVCKQNEITVIFMYIVLYILLFYL